MPLNIPPNWQPKRISGNTAYYFNPSTGETKSVYIPSAELSQRKKEFQQWRNRQAIEKGIIPKAQVVAWTPQAGVTKYYDIPRGNISTLQRDPMAPYDYQKTTKRIGTVEKVISGDRVVVDGVVVKIKYMDAPTFHENREEWYRQKTILEKRILGKKVWLSVNLENERAANGDTLANVNVEDTGESIADIMAGVHPQISITSNEQWWSLGFWDKVQSTAWATTAGVGNVLERIRTGKWGKATWRDKKLGGTLLPNRGEFDPSTVESFARTYDYKFDPLRRLVLDLVVDVANLFMIGGGAGTRLILSSSAKFGTRTISLTAKGERQLLILTKMYNSEYVARREMAHIIETRGKSAVGFVSKGGLRITGTEIELIKGKYFYQTFGYAKTQLIKAANLFDRPVVRAGAEPFIDRFNRLFRRVATLPNPAYYTINAVFGVWNAILGRTNLARYKTIEQGLRYANNPVMKDRVLFTSIYGKKWTSKEIAIEMEKYKLTGQGGIGDVARNRAYAATTEDRFWEPMLKLVQFEENRIRGAMFVDRLQKGDVPELAAQYVYKFQFNYDPRALTAFEQRYMHRVIPFYVAQSRNLALQAEMLARTPYKFAPVPKIMSAMEGRPNEQAMDTERQERGQFRDYEKGTILIKHPYKEGAYFKIRLPTEDIALLANKLGTPEKVILSTYPIYNMPLELAANRAFFDNRKITPDLQTYLVKKFFSRPYYTYKDVTNPNKPIGEKALRTITGISVTYKEIPRVSIYDEAVEAGLSPSFDEWANENAKKTREYRDKRAKRVVEYAKEQARKPPELRDTPPKWNYFWDTLMIPWYWMGARVRNLGVTTNYYTNRYLGEPIELPQNKYWTVGDRITIADTTSAVRAIKMLLGKPLNPRDEMGNVTYQGGWEGGFWDRMLTNIRGDPSRYFRLGATGSKVLVKGVPVALTEEGALAKGALASKWGEAEGARRLEAVLKAHPEYMQKYGLYVSGTSIGYGVIPGVWLLKQRTRLRELTSPYTEPIRAIGVSGVSYIGKKISATTARIKTLKAYEKLVYTKKTIEIEVRQAKIRYNNLAFKRQSEYLSFRFIEDIKGERIYLTRKGAKDFTKFNKDFGVKEGRHRMLGAIKQDESLVLTRYDIEKVENIQPAYNEMIRKLRSQIQADEADTKIMRDEAKTILGVKNWKKEVAELSDMLETGIGRDDPALQAKWKLIDEIIKREKEMAKNEMDRDILTIEIDNYLRRVLTPEGKKSLRLPPTSGRIDLTNPMQVLNPKNAFTEHRHLKGTMAEINAEKGFEFFERNIFKSYAYRAKESRIAVATHDFLEPIYIKYGKDIRFERELRGTYRRINPNIPGAERTLLPNKVADEIENIPEIKAYIEIQPRFPNAGEKVLKVYDAWNKIYQANVTIWAVAFYTKNIVSSRIMNWKLGVRNPSEDISTFRNLVFKSGETIKTRTGQTYTYEQFMAAAREDGILNQPSMLGRDASGWLGYLPRSVLMAEEKYVRLQLYKHRLIEGDKRQFAKKFVTDYHMDYDRELTKTESIYSRLGPFAIWNLGNPVAQVRTIVTRPGSYAMVPKFVNSWNTQADKVMLEKRPDYLSGTQMMSLRRFNSSIPGAESKFVRIPGAWEDLSMLQGVLQWQSHAFYWDEALRNPDMVRAFARREQMNEWLTDGGGVATIIDGNTIRIEYMTTGQTVTAALSPDKSKLVFVDDELNEILKEYGVDSNDGKREVRRDNEPYYKLASRYLYSWGELASGSLGYYFGYPVKDWRTGYTVPEDELRDWFFDKLGGGRFSYQLELVHDKNKSDAERSLNILGLTVYDTQDWVKLPPEIKREVAREQMRKVRKSYHGCGF